MKFLAVLIIFCCVSPTSWGLKPDEVLKKMGDVYRKNESYQVRLKYELFKGDKSTKVESFYNGMVVRDNNNVYKKIDESEFVTTPNFSLKISHTEQLIELADGEKVVPNELDFERTKKECSTIAMEENEMFYFITMKYKKASQEPFSEVRLKINKANFHLYQLDFFYWHYEDFDEDPNVEELDNPHLKVTYLDFSKKVNLDKEVFVLDRYLASKNASYALQGNYRQYTLIDNQTK